MNEAAITLHASLFTQGYDDKRENRMYLTDFYDEENKETRKKKRGCLHTYLPTLTPHLTYILTVVGDDDVSVCKNASRVFVRTTNCMKMMMQLDKIFIG